MDHANLLEQLTTLLAEHEIDYCVIGGQAVNAYAEPLVSKVWAAQDPTCRASKRQKDLADIARLLEGYPSLRVQLPPDILARLVLVIWP